MEKCATKGCKKTVWQKGSYHCEVCEVKRYAPAFTATLNSNGGNNVETNGR